MVVLKLTKRQYRKLMVGLNQTRREHRRIADHIDIILERHVVPEYSKQSIRDWRDKEREKESRFEQLISELNTAKVESGPTVNDGISFAQHIYSNRLGDKGRQYDNMVIL